MTTSATALHHYRGLNSEVDPAGVAYMSAHIRIAKRTAPAPRLHYYDDAVSSGKVYVGYLGAHLPTARFN